MVSAMLAGGCRKSGSNAPRPRIISYSPSVTDIIYDLGLGEHLVGVTSWCINPPGMDKKPVIGNEKNPNTEAMLVFEPDIVFIQQDPSRFDPLKKLRPEVRIISVKHDSVSGIYDSIMTIGQAAGVSERAEKLVAKIKSRIERVRKRNEGKPRPRVLFVMGYDHPSTCGSGTYLDELIRIAGGINVAAQRHEGWPTINAEIILALKPDVLICLTNPSEVEAARKYWMSLRELPAVANERVYISTERRMTIFGSLVADVAEQFADWIHPSAAAQPKGLQQ